MSQFTTQTPFRTVFQFTHPEDYDVTIDPDQLSELFSDPTAFDLLFQHEQQLITAMVDGPSSATDSFTQALPEVQVNGNTSQVDTDMVNDQFGHIHEIKSEMNSEIPQANMATIPGLATLDQKPNGVALYPDSTSPAAQAPYVANQLPPITSPFHAPPQPLPQVPLPQASFPHPGLATTTSHTPFPPAIASAVQAASSAYGATPMRGTTPVAGAINTLPPSAIIPSANPHGSPTRVYINQKVTPYLLEGMKWVALNEPEKPLKWLADFLEKRSKEVEGT